MFGPNPTVTTGANFIKVSADNVPNGTYVVQVWQGMTKKFEASILVTDGPKHVEHTFTPADAGNYEVRVEAFSGEFNVPAVPD